MSHEYSILFSGPGLDGVAIAGLVLASGVAEGLAGGLMALQIQPAQSNSLARWLSGSRRTIHRLASVLALSLTSLARRT